jgi:vitamin B12 transporter
MLRAGLSILAVLLAGNLAAQERRVDSLGGVEVHDQAKSAIVDSKAAFQPGVSAFGIDSATRRRFELQQLSTLIAMATPVFVRSYGVNSLATLSFRGASSAQSAVLWEGVPLMNAATGISDISLLPVAFSDSISIRYGGSGAMDGSGNVGGALLLQSKASRFGKGFSVSGSVQGIYGSFGQSALGGSVELRSSRAQFRLRLIHQSADNNFQAQDQSGLSFRTAHAGMQGQGGLAELALKISARDELKLYAWIQDYRRDIPRALFEQFSDKHQEDASARYLVRYTHLGRAWQHYLKASWMEEFFYFTMPSSRILTDIRTEQFFGEAGTERGFGKWGRVLVFVPVQLSQLRSRDTTANQQRVGIAASWRKNAAANRLHLALNLRAEQIDGNAFVLPGTSAAYDLGRDWTLRGSIQRSYRAPTLNERYYVPGGNPQLKPEQGWSGEAGYQFRANGSGLEFRHELTAFTRLIDNWIIWLGGAIWTPHNLAQVWSRGLETDNSLRGKIGAFRWRTGLNAALTSATPTKSLLPNDNSIGKQIPYTPYLSGNLQLGLGWKQFDLIYLHAYSGLRYITSDQSGSVPAYHTADLIASASLLRGQGLTLQLSLRNMYDFRYSVIAYRPMPGRSFLAGFRMDL